MSTIQTNAQALIDGQYKTDKELNVRQSFNDLFEPKIHLDTEILKRLPNNKDISILDVGCGSGNTLMFLRERGYTEKMVGIDISEGIMKKGIDLSEKYALAFQQATAEDLPFDENAFDVVIARHVLYHVDDISLAIQEIHRVLKPTGVFIITLNSFENKPVMLKLRQFVKEKFDIGMIRNEERIGTLPIQEYLSSLFDFEYTELSNSLHLATPDKLAEYFNTYQNTGEPIPSHKKWQTIMNDVKNYLQSLIDENPDLMEKNVASITLAKPKRI